MTQATDYSDWRSVLVFGPPRSVGELDRSKIDALPGLYVIQRNAGALAVGNVIYVGRSNNLRVRIAGYLRGSCRHKGAAFVADHIGRYGSHHVFIRWAIWDRPLEYEGELIFDLAPWYNSRYEKLWEYT